MNYKDLDKFVDGYNSDGLKENKDIAGDVFDILEDFKNPSKKKEVNENKSGKEIVKTGRKIDGFVWEDKNGNWWYAFGKPSQPSYIAFEARDKQEAIKKIKNIASNAQMMFSK